VKKNQQNTFRRIVNTFTATAVFLLVLLITLSPASGNDDEEEFLIPGRGYAVDYYESYGEPIIKASITGDTEFERGEEAVIQIKIANKGTIEGFKRLYANQKNIPDSREESIALAEMEAEKNCTTAKGIKANLTSESDYIDIEPTTGLQTVDKLETGNTRTLNFTISIDSTAPGGVYELKLPVTYEYQNNTLTETSDVINLGITDAEYIREYSIQNITLPIHISIKEEPMFEISNISGSLTQGSANTINVTYTNTGEVAAEDAEVRFVTMRPLSIRNTIVRLGTIYPGESGVASLEILADSEALIKNYSIDSEIRYIDNEGENELSDNMKVEVPVEPAESKISTILITGILLALILVYQIIKLLRKRKRKSENASGDEND